MRGHTLSDVLRDTSFSEDLEYAAERTFVPQTKREWQEHAANQAARRPPRRPKPRPGQDGPTQ